MRIDLKKLFKGIFKKKFLTESEREERGEEGCMIVLIIFVIVLLFITAIVLAYSPNSL